MFLLLFALVTVQTPRLAPFPARAVEAEPQTLPDSIFLPPARRVDPDRWLAMDKFWHFSASFATVGAGYHLGANRLGLDHAPATGIALGGTFALGLTKEFHDLAGPSNLFSWKDLTADLLGIGTGYLVFVHDWNR